MILKTIAKELVILMGLSTVTAFVVNAVSEKGIALLGEWDTSMGVVTARSKDDAVHHDLEIGEIEEARQLYDSGAVFVDARAAEDYDGGHIKGALSLPAWQFEERIDSFKNEIPPSMMIVTYCSGRECDDSHMLAQRLLDEGYADVRVFIDGYPAWKAHGHPVEP
jgi:rhodanese-related sulfurtransferase